MSCTVTKSSVKGTNLPSSKGCKCSCPFATPYSLLRVKIARILNGYEPGLDRNSEPPKCSTMLFHLGQRSLFLATQRWFDLGNSYWCINLPSCPTLVAPNALLTWPQEVSKTSTTNLRPTQKSVEVDADAKMTLTLKSSLMHASYFADWYKRVGESRPKHQFIIGWTWNNQTNNHAFKGKNFYFVSWFCLTDNIFF